MKLPSQNCRFFVLDIPGRKIIDQGLVAQGINTKNDEQGHLIFSNELHSGCTSLGKYRIGEKYQGRFGTSFRLYGLDKSNSNAFARAIVLHGYKTVPDLPQTGDICYSQGCPMVSINFFKKLEKIIDSSSKPILLDIIN